MSKRTKLLLRLRGCPTDFTFEEAVTLLKACGYRVSNAGKTSGSRVKFVRGGHIIRMHKPHPRKELPMPQIKQLIEDLKGEKT